jgi:outer membrane protein assembly factor BamB
MSETTIDREIDALNRFWNELVAPGTTHSAVDEEPIGQEIEQLLRDLHASASTIAGHSELPAMRFARQPAGEPVRTDRASAKSERRWLGRENFGSGRRGAFRALSVLATAAMLIAALSGVLLSGGLWRGGESTISGVAPNATGPDIGHTGVVEGIPPASGVTQEWQMTLDGPVAHRPAIGNGVVVLAMADGTLLALELADGSERWRRTLDPYAMGEPTIVEGIVLIAEEGRLLALNAEDGETYWSVSDVSSSSVPIVDSGRVYAVTSRAGTGSVGLLGVELTSGKELWRNERLPGVVKGQPAAGNGLVYAAAGEVTVVALDGPTGTLVWQQPTSGRVDSPVVAGDTVYVAGYRGLLALDAKTGVMRWRKLGELGNATPAPGDDLSTQPPAVAEGMVFLPRGGNSLRALDAVTGDVRWVWEREGYHHVFGAQPVVVAGHLLLDVDGNTQAWDPATSEYRWSIPHAFVQELWFAAGDERLVQVGDGHTVRCYTLIPL